MRVRNFALDAGDQTGAQRARRNQQLMIGDAARIARQRVEEVGDVLSDIFAAGQQRKIFVDPRRRGVVVAGAQVDVAAEAVALAAHHQRYLRMRLQIHLAIDHMHARALQHARPLNVVLFVEARLQLHQHRNLLAQIVGLQQRLDDLRIRRRRDRASA